MRAFVAALDVMNSSDYDSFVKLTKVVSGAASALMKFLWVTGVILAIAAGVFIAVTVTKGCM